MSIVDLILGNVDPVTGVLLIGMWYRLEKYAKRLNRIENKFIDTNKL